MIEINSWWLVVYVILYLWTYVAWFTFMLKYFKWKTKAQILQINQQAVRDLIEELSLIKSKWNTK